MSRKINVFVRAELVGNLKKFRCYIFFCSRKSAVVSHNSTDIAKSQKQIRFFEKRNLMSLFHCAYRRRTSRPAGTYYHYFAH